MFRLLVGFISQALRCPSFSIQLSKHGIRLSRICQSTLIPVSKRPLDYVWKVDFYRHLSFSISLTLEFDMVVMIDLLLSKCRYAIVVEVYLVL